LETEGWIFDKAQYPVIEKRARRFFQSFGKSDGTIVACFPSDRNDGVTLYRLQHDDGDIEDLDDSDLQDAMKAFQENKSKKEVDGDHDDEHDDCDEAEADEVASEVSVDDRAQLGEFDRLWATVETRMRWQQALNECKTVSELALGLAALEEHAHRFLPFTINSSLPLMFRDPTHMLSKSIDYSSHAKPHSFLGTRKAKKRAAIQISRIAQESDFDESNIESEFFNSGRPTRQAALRVASYVE
jgi:hypothetical protein